MVKILIIYKRKLKKVSNNLKKHNKKFFKKEKRAVRNQIRIHTPDLFICGHSHILKVINDKKLKLLHMNPGAAGTHGFHKVRTMLRFEVTGEKIQNLEVIEFKRNP